MCYNIKFIVVYSGNGTHTYSLEFQQKESIRLIIPIKCYGVWIFMSWPTKCDRESICKGQFLLV